MCVSFDSYMEIHICGHVFHNLEGCLTSCVVLVQSIYNNGSSSSPLFHVYTADWVHHLIEDLKHFTRLKCSLMNLLIDSLFVDYLQLSVILETQENKACKAQKADRPLLKSKDVS